MLRIGLLISLCFLTSFCLAQKESALSKNTRSDNTILYNKDQQDQFCKGHDLAKLWTTTSNEFVFGFIGDTYQRIRIKFITVKKKTGSIYEVYGKSMVKNNVCELRGTINITKLSRYKITSNGVDDELKGQGIKGQYSILGNYEFSEDKNQSHAGIFKGTFKTYLYLDRNNNIHYDDIDLNADSFTNNEFTGTWTQYNTTINKVCNWGDHRIPNSSDLDKGAGEFAPADKYIKNGWQTVRDRADNNAIIAQKATKQEQAAWWK